MPIEAETPKREELQMVIKHKKRRRSTLRYARQAGFRLRLSIPPDWAEGIGLVVAHWAFLEMLTDQWLAGALSRSSRHEHLLRADSSLISGSFNTRVKHLTDAVQSIVSEEEQVKKLNQLVRRLMAAQKKRNLIVHGHWGISPDNQVSATLTVPGYAHLTRESQTISVAELRALAKELSDLSLEVAQNVNAIVSNMQR